MTYSAGSSLCHLGGQGRSACNEKRDERSAEEHVDDLVI